ncbi:hypothetical protein HN385_03555 [archaeon]|mgnify:CR=1 FL=1|jgi:hypothetical protein|nr:hypothetical protein [archaeon]MBT3451207.1 hypothetical protein [archaeon]MBT6869773.1 hypothetical protein [archaeon]MBT7192728.1 hypothetical protein [archaeon]MBT7380753.1 hypothetical protein [archaeon]
MEQKYQPKEVPEKQKKKDLDLRYLLEKTKQDEWYGICKGSELEQELGKYQW